MGQTSWKTTTFTPEEEKAKSTTGQYASQAPPRSGNWAAVVAASSGYVR